MINFFKNMFQSIIDFFINIIVFVLNVLEPILKFFLKTFFDVVVALLDLLPSISFSHNLTALGLIEQIPENFQTFLWYGIDRTGISTAFFIFFTALLIKFTLKLIPYIRNLF